jgi:hypothetical protein
MMGYSWNMNGNSKWDNHWDITSNGVINMASWEIPAVGAIPSLRTNGQGLWEDSHSPNSPQHSWYSCDNSADPLLKDEHLQIFCATQIIQ